MTKKRNVNQHNGVDYSDVTTSIRDLAKIYKPTDIKSFVKSFIRKYNVQKGYEEKLEAIVREELNGGMKSEV